MSEQTKPTGGNTSAIGAEVLSMTPGVMEGKSVVVLTLRPDLGDGSFKSLNYFISGQQFKRLIRDGQSIIERSEQLRGDPEPECPEPPHYLDHNPEDQPPKKSRKKR